MCGCRPHVSLWTVLVVVVSVSVVWGQVDEDGVYRGKYLGKFNSFHHQVSGDVYAVDEYTFLIRKFVYDGNGPDTFFWTGTSNQPGPQGILVPNEYGRTNKLKAYLNKDITISLLEGKKITDFRWLAVFDLTVGKAYADIYIPEGFEPPSPQRLSDLSRLGHGVKSGSVIIKDAKTFIIQDFEYDGKGTDTFFWVGEGYQPASKGTKVPDEMGYVNSLRAYHKEDVTLEVPGQLTVFDIDWLSIYDIQSTTNYGSIIIPSGLNVPPSLVDVVTHERTLPHCEQLHKRLQISWEVFGPQITVEMVGQIEDDEYMAFGFSGSQTSSQMEGADAVVAYTEGHLFVLKDYNITAKTPCSNTLGTYHGVCPDTLMGGMENFQFHSGKADNGLSIITFRRHLKSPDAGDFTINPDEPSYIVWALGKLDANNAPTFHHIYPKADIKFTFGRKEEKRNCPEFTQSNKRTRKPWGPFRIAEIRKDLFLAHIGPSGGHRGYTGMTNLPTSGFSWYMEGYLAGELYLKRGKKYKFKVEGGNNPYNPSFYHPFIITDEPIGGFGSRTKEEQQNIKVFAGVKFSRRGQPRPTAAGRLCLWKHKDGDDRRQDDDFTNFKLYRNSLELKCDEGDPAYLEVTPNASWPETVYYNSYTHPHMGWKIHIVDTIDTSVSKAQHAVLSSYATVLITLFVLLLT